MTDSANPQTEIHREVGSRKIAAGQARTALIRLRYDATIEEVWAAFTEPGRLSRWFLEVRGDLRPGGTFELRGNASGEILRCEPPRLLTVSWVYGDRPVDEVELRLSPSAGDTAGTILELDHATVSGLVEWQGQMLDVIPGVGSGWELPLTFALPAYLRGDLPDAPASEWFKPTPEIEQLGLQIAQAWAALSSGPSPAPRTPGAPG